MEKIERWNIIYNAPYGMKIREDFTINFQGEREIMKRRDFLKVGLAGIGTLALTGRTQGVEYYPVKSDKKCAVIYSTWCGSSRDAAVWISHGLF